MIKYFSIHPKFKTARLFKFFDMVGTSHHVLIHFISGHNKHSGRVPCINADISISL